MKKVDQTIEKICEWIQTKLEDTGKGDSSHEVAEMTKALAELVSARTQSIF